MSKIKVLQIGENDWTVGISVPENVQWFYWSAEEIATNLSELQLEADAKIQYNAIFLSDGCFSEQLLLLDKYVEVYELFYTDKISWSDECVFRFLKKKMAQKIKKDDKHEIVYDFSKILFSGQYGAKLHPFDLIVNENLKSNSYFEGNNYLVVAGNFGHSYITLATYQYNIMCDNSIRLDLWLEHVLQLDCDIRLNVRLINSGSVDNIIKEWTVEGRLLLEPVVLDFPNDGYLSITIQARGYGKIKLGPLHYRHSRDGFGQFILGGERYADSTGRELFYYFYPGDCKPPLNVYFSGYRSAEGFEGYWMMKEMGTPFLLIADPASEGGRFYLGSTDYEKKVVEVIQKAMTDLGFSNKDLILSGLSMGAFGALYYGIDLNPHAIIVGKPLVNLGTMASSEKILRSKIFPTSLDLLYYICGDLSLSSIETLDNRFKIKLEEVGEFDSQLLFAYMKHDDYDSAAFEDLLKYSLKSSVSIIGKGWDGRHNDNSTAVIRWFINLYQRVLERDFGRG